MNILFWNVKESKGRNNERIEDCLAELISENECDIIILAEYAGSMHDLCGFINARSNTAYEPLSAAGCDHIRGLINNEYQVEVLQPSSRYLILQVETTLRKILLAMIHNVDKTNKESTQRHELQCFSRDIREKEIECGTNNTIAIGDFNAHPFDPSCVGADAMHAIPYIDEVRKQKRKKNGRDYYKFYNPMWKFLSRREAPYATLYYYNSKDLENYYWNLFDQVMIRPQLIEAFDEEALAIIERTQNHVLLRKKSYTKIPDKKKYSDHLPIYCRLEEAKIP